ncbi:MAG: baseplate J/gp47 family protein [Acidimicrobiia bacterium]
MPFPTPNLDDRTFLDLMAEARSRIEATCPDWTDLSVHDPGVVLLEAFAYLTETMLYRLNRLPDKAYVAFLNLIGITLRPPSAAGADLRFSRDKPGGGPIEIPAGTQVTATGGVDATPPVFVTTTAAILAEGADSVMVRAYHCAAVDGELLGTGTGRAGLSLTVPRGPICTTDEAIDLLLGVEADPGSLPTGATAREFAGRTFELWQAVPTFAGTGTEAKVFQVDRAAGVVSFAPELDGRSSTPPAAGAEVRLWYRTGGGAGGNVGAGLLTTMKTPIAGLKVANPDPARGGRALEPVEEAMARGPQEFFSLRRAVTARDFEMLATLSSSAVARARAFTRAEVWSFAPPGEVEVVLVPHVPESARPGGRLPLQALLDHQVDAARQRTHRELEQRHPLGIRCVTTWGHFKEVSVHATVVVRGEEDAHAVQQRVLERLHQTISPLPTASSPTGWPFGEALRASNVYRMLEQAEPGVRYADSVSFVVGEAPDGEVRTVAADEYQLSTWYAGCGDVLFRSTNDGDGWEPAGRFDGAEVRRVVPYPGASRPGIVPRPGHVAVITRTADGAAVHVSTDLAETWAKVSDLQTPIADLAWIDRDGVPVLLLATDTGLYEQQLLPGATPLAVVVDTSDADRGFYAVAAFPSERGDLCVALAAQAQFGVYLSVEGGRGETFRLVGLDGEITRTLAVQMDGPTTWLWVGTGEADPNAAGAGCFRARLFEASVRWEALGTGWGGGTCWSLAFPRGTVLAGSQSGGVLRLDPAAPQPQWQAADVNSGLPLRDRPRFEPVVAVAGRSAAARALAGGPRGVFRTEGDHRWRPTANRESADLVTIPDTWLLCSGEHEIKVVTPGATLGD